MCGSASSVLAPFVGEAINLLPARTLTKAFFPDILEVGVMGKYKWGPDTTIELLNAVQRWEVDIKETQQKGRGNSKWQWVATQLFVPDEEWDVNKLSKRCERRLALLRANYESYFYQLMLMEESLAHPPPSPPPIRFEAAVWEKMIKFFGEPKIIPKRPQTGIPAVAPPLTCTAASVQNNRKENKVDDDQHSEDEPAGAIYQDQPEESSSSSVGSNHSYKDPLTPFLARATGSTGSSYYEIPSSDGHEESSEGLSQSTAITFDNYNESCGSSVHDTPEIDVSVSITVSESSSHDETSITLGSFSDDSDDIAHGRKPGAAAAGSVATTPRLSSSSFPGTAISRANYRSLIEDLKCYDPFHVSPAAAGLPVEESEHSSSKSSDSSSTESKSCSAKYCDASCACTCRGSSPSGKSSGQATHTVDKKQNSVSCDSRMLGSSLAQGELKDETVPIAAAGHGEAGYGGSPERGGSSSSKAGGGEIGFVFYTSDQPQNVQQLPASFSGLSLNHPPSPAAAAGDGDDGLAKSMCDDEGSRGRTSKLSSSREHPHEQESGSRIRRVSSSSSFRLPASSPEPSSSSSVQDTIDKDDNVNLMVYIKLNNLKAG